MADQKAGKVVYLRGSKEKEKLFRSVLGTRENPLILMSHCERGGDRLIGRGAYKSVKLCVDLNTGQRKVVAVFRKFDPETGKPVSPYLLSLAKREAEIMERCKKEGIAEAVQLDFSHETDEYIFLVMEECEQGDLFDMLDRARASKETALSLRSRLNIALDLARALEKLHEKGILHRDIKSENAFLFRTPGGFHAKLGDFGLACDESDKENRLIPTGSTSWLSRNSAQLLANRSFGKDKEATLAAITTQNDMDPLGYILYQLFHSRHEPLPFQVADDLPKSIEATVKFSKADLEKSLNKIHRPYRGVLQGIFFGNWTAKDVRIALEEIQKTGTKPNAAAPVPRGPTPAPAITPPPPRQSPVAVLERPPMALTVPMPAPTPPPQASVG